MKRFFTLALSLAALFPTFGQGTINFYNNNLTGPNGVYRAGVFLDNEPMVRFDSKGDSTIGAGPAYTAGLFLASNPSTPLATTPFRSTAPFEVFANFVPDVIIPGVPPGSTAQLVV